MNAPGRRESLYDALTVELPQTAADAASPPETVLTATIETVDNDRAYTLMGGVPVV
jgi:hypothetical protein